MKFFSFFPQFFSRTSKSIASPANAFSFGISIRQDMRKIHFLTESKTAIASIDFTGNPQPTRISFINLIPKSLRQLHSGALA